MFYVSCQFRSVRSALLFLVPCFVVRESVEWDMADNDGDILWWHVPHIDQQPRLQEYKSLTRTLLGSVWIRQVSRHLNRKMEIIQKCNKIYWHCFYGVVLWELYNNNNGLDYQDVKKVVTSIGKWKLFNSVIRNLKVKDHHSRRLYVCIIQKPMLLCLILVLERRM